MKKNLKGFTLIELVIVIVILGILAAVAIPKFADIQSDAKKSAVEGLAGAVASAANVVKGKCLIEKSNGNISGTTDTVTIDGTTVTVLSDNCTPVAEAGGIDVAISYDSNKYTFTAGTTSSTFSYKSTLATDCGFTYREGDGSVAITANSCS